MKVRLSAGKLGLFFIITRGEYTGCFTNWHFSFELFDISPIINPRYRSLIIIFIVNNWKQFFSILYHNTIITLKINNNNISIKIKSIYSKFIYLFIYHKRDKWIWITEKRKEKILSTIRKKKFSKFVKRPVSLLSRRNHEMVAHSQIYIYIYLPPFTYKEEAGDHDCVGGKGWTVM